MIDLTNDERELLRGMRAVTLDAEGQEVFVGLTAEESEVYLPLSRRHEGGEDMTSDLRFAELHARHEQARQTIVAGKAPLDRH